MPKRVVDGDAVWRSKKLKQMRPEFRAEYANLVPLAEANGVFEVDVDRVWSDVYSYNRDGVTVETVSEILAELESVGLLRVWEESGKTWGYWEGIHKSGRLPKASELQKYKNLPPNPPDRTSISGDSAEDSLIVAPRFGIGLVLDRSSLGAELQDKTEILEQDGQDMKLKKEIQAVCAGFGIKPGGYDDTWELMAALEKAHSRGAVVRGFTEYMEENQGDDFPKGAVAAYLQVAAARLVSGVSSVSVAAKAPEVVSLVRELTYVSDGKVKFADRQKPVLAELAAEYSQSEILGVFKTWLDDQDLSDPRTVQYAAKNFVECADALCYSARRKKSERVVMDTERELAKARLQAEADAERVAAEGLKKDEELAFDPLADVV